MHRLAASKDERPSTMLGHKGAIMCMDAQRHAEDGTVLSSSSTLITGSVDHHVGVWDLETGGTCLAFLAGHARSVHCLTLGHRGGTAHDGASVSWRPRRSVHVLEQGVEDVVLHAGWGGGERPGRESSALW